MDVALLGLIVAIVGTIATIVGVYYARRQVAGREALDIGDDEFKARLKEKQTYFGSITPEGSKVTIWSNEKSKFEIINGDITTASCEIIVSSDDNFLTARGGVSKAIVTKAGKSVLEELAELRKFRWKHGAIAITRAGAFPSRYIVHPAVIDLRTNTYPSAQTISSVTKKCLEFSNLVAADSLALPVLGGGTGSKSLTPGNSIKAICREVMDYLNKEECAIEYVALFVFDKKDLPAEIAPKADSGQRLQQG